MQLARWCVRLARALHLLEAEPHRLLAAALHVRHGRRHHRPVAAAASIGWEEHGEVEDQVGQDAADQAVRHRRCVDVLVPIVDGLQAKGAGR